MDISATQVIASVLASVTGAVAASFLGVGGTVIGAALMSVASTAVAGIYKHGLARSRERLQAAAEAGLITPLVGGGAMSAFRGRQRPAAQDQTGDDQRTVTSPQVPGEIRAPGPGADPTAMFLVAGAQPPAEFQTRPWNETDQFAQQPRDPVTADGAPAGPAGRVTAPNGPAGKPAPDDAGPASTRGGAHRRRDSGTGRRPRLLVLAGLALGVFLLVMAGVTVFEAVAGKPLDAVVTGKSGSGTTIGSIVGGNSHAASHTKPGSPAVTPHTTTTPGASTAPSPTPSQSPSPSPAASPAAGGDSPDTLPSTGASSGAVPGGTPAPGRSP